MGFKSSFRAEGNLEEGDLIGDRGAQSRVRELGLSGHIFTRAYRQLLPITWSSIP